MGSVDLREYLKPFQGVWMSQLLHNNTETLFALYAMVDVMLGMQRQWGKVAFFTCTYRKRSQYYLSVPLLKLEK